MLDVAHAIRAPRPGRIEDELGDGLGVLADDVEHRSREAAAEADLRELVATCILPSMSGDSNIDIEIRNGALAAIHRI